MALSGDLNRGTGIEVGNVFALGTEYFQLGSRTMGDRVQLELLGEGKRVERVFDLARVCLRFRTVGSEPRRGWRLEDELEHLRWIQRAKEV